MSSVPVVHGITVEDPYHKVQDSDPGASPVQYDSPNDFETNQQRPEPRHQYQDVVWAVAFYAHLLVILFFIFVGLQSSGEAAADEGQGQGSYGGIYTTVCVTGGVAVTASLGSLSFMMNNAESLVQSALIFSVASSLAIGVFGLMMGSMLMALLGLISFAVGICYASKVWHRIPFAAANLKTALSAVRQNLGLVGISLVFAVLAFFWTLAWFMGLGRSLSDNSLVVVFLLFLSYYWVHQVLQNTMHVTTSGTVATWWFVPEEANSCFSQAQSDSLSRALTYSFGSICFGSFLVAVIQALRALERYTRNERDYQFISCIIQCILSMIQSIIEYINQWAYVYVGMYGFSYIEAGQNVVELFQNKGWTVIIADDLASNVLFMIAVAIGMASGLTGLALAATNPDMFASLGIEEVKGAGFLIGLLSGFLFSSVILSVVASAINTVIVCYAEDPASFRANHPELAASMQQAWVQAWPDLQF